MIKIFFDASVIIAALLSASGGSAKLSRLVKDKTIIGVTSQTVLDEVKKHQRKIKRSEKEIDRLIIDNSFLVSERIKKSETGKYVGRIDQNDAHLIAGANLTHCEYLTTLDKKHLLKKEIINQFKPLIILSPKDLLQKIA